MGIEPNPSRTRALIFEKPNTNQKHACELDKNPNWTKPKQVGFFPISRTSVVSLNPIFVSLGTLLKLSWHHQLRMSLTVIFWCQIIIQIQAAQNGRYCQTVTVISSNKHSQQKFFCVCGWFHWKMMLLDYWQLRKACVSKVQYDGHSPWLTSNSDYWLGL